MRTLATALAALCALVLTALFVQTGPEIVSFIMIILGIIFAFFIMTAAVLWSISRRKH